MYTLVDFAERLLDARAHRIPFRFDGRLVKALRRRGLQVYPDGTYSLSVDAMLRAVLTWEGVARVGDIKEDRRLELEHWAEIGRSFIARHQAPTPKTFGDNLATSRYTALWRLVVGGREEVFHGPEMTIQDKALWAALEKRNYVTVDRRGDTVFVRPTPAGDHLVTTIGNPFFVA
jgi:hypothetical protein